MSPTYTRRKNRHYGYYISQAVRAEATLARNWQDWDTREQIPVINDLVVSVVVARETITIQLDRNHLIRQFTGSAPVDDGANTEPAPPMMP